MAKVNCLFYLLLLDLLSGIYCKKCHESKETQTIYSQEQQLALLQRAGLKCLEGIQLPESKTDSYCEQVFDGLMCWPVTKAGTVSVQKCATYVHKFSDKGFATRTCLEDGEWYYNPEFNRTWTNYSGCLQTDGSTNGVPDIILKHQPRIQLFYNIGYGISLISLLIAVTMMLYFRKLHCQRNTVHINMFISFILRSIICFIKDINISPAVYISYGRDEDSPESWVCKMISTLFNYILTANFMWIFVEGLFLHTYVLSTKYNVSKKLYRTFLILGWCLPVLPVIPWIAVRLKFNNTLCWNTNDQDFIWIIKGPIMLTNVINLMFFINIIRVLYSKLNASNTRDPRKFRRLARSTLVLIPLFGVYYIVFIAVPMCMDPELEVIWLYSEMFFNSFQGLAVALLFCFLNGEVQREIRKHWRRRMLRRPSNISARSKSFMTATGDHDTRHSMSPNSWDTNGNMELKELTIPVCSVNIDLNINSSQEPDEMSPILTKH